MKLPGPQALNSKQAIQKIARPLFNQEDGPFFRLLGDGLAFLLWGGAASAFAAAVATFLALAIFAILAVLAHWT